MQTLGLYLHIPFCRSKCLYCDFCSFPHPDAETISRYLKALECRLRAASDACREYTVDSVYFGGGTPTLLPGSALTALLETVAKSFHLSKSAEISLECNPATGDASSFAALRRAGFNRVSVGLQSVHPNELKALGRLHSFADFTRTVSDIRNAGFSNLSVDLMSGIPYQTADSWRATLETVCAFSPEHLSAYGLIVEEGTPFGRRGEASLSLPDEDTARTMYFDGIDFLADHGLRQYEISNFAQPGYESRHNLKYWNCDAFLGFGPSAYSDFEGRRFGYSRDLSAFLDGRDDIVDEETPTPAERASEYIMLRMRLCDGVSRPAFAARFPEIPFDETFGNKLAAYLPTGFVRSTPTGYAFTPEGMYVSNAILSEVI